MAIFFVDWELWQDMTFILACAIVLVFVIGLAKLWWTNRMLRELEHIDEEKRARLLEIRQCGLNIPGVDQIPFGVRAIKSGVEVEGIWISRPNTPEPSQSATSSVNIPQSNCSSAEGSKHLESTVQGYLNTHAVDPGTSFHAQSHHLDSNHSTDHANPTRDVKNSKSDCDMETSLYDAAPVSSSYSPRMASPAREVTSSPDANDESACTLSATDDEITHIDTATAVRFSSIWNIQAPLLHGSAEIYANRQTRRSNANFEVLPAGTLGSRIELEDITNTNTSLESARISQQTERKKLRKSGPAK